jgi:hypothetical protein
MTVQLFCFLTDPEIAKDQIIDGYFEGTFTTRREARRYAAERLIDWARKVGLPIDKSNALRWHGDDALLGADRAFKIRQEVPK